MSAQLQVLGAADTVTGSRYLVETETARILVDCGLFQCDKVLRSRSGTDSPGPVYATPGTIDLCGELLPDSGHLMEEGARRAASGHWSKHSEPRPLYTADDALRGSQWT